MNLSKTSTLLIATSALAILAGCSRASNDLEIKPGPEGTYIALGTDIEGSISNESTTFDFTKSAGKNVSIGVAVAGPYPQAKDSEKLFKPASITKLVTTALALKTLGPDFTYSTNVYVTPGSQAGSARDITVIANGDPQVVKKFLNTGVGQQTVLTAISQELKSQGIVRIEGAIRLLSDDERRDEARSAFGIMIEDKISCDGTVAQSFNLNWNCGPLKISNGQTAWTSHDFRNIDANLLFPVSHQGGGGRLSVAPQQDAQDHTVGYQVAGSGSAALLLPVPDAKSWYGNTLKTVLMESGIDASNAVVEMPTGRAANDVRASLSNQGAFTIASDKLSDLVVFTNKPSDNFLADTLFKSLGEKHGPTEDLRLSARAAVNDGVAKWLQASGHPEFSNEVRLVDGAGLSHDNRVSARAYVALLREFTKEPTFQALWNSLPIAGVDGTLKVKMNNSIAEGKVRAKTGTLRGSYQLAGYVPKYSSDRRTIESYVPFVILSATTPEKRFDVFKLQTQLATKLLTLVNP